MIEIIQTKLLKQTINARIRELGWTNVKSTMSYNFEDIGGIDQ